MESLIEWRMLELSRRLRRRRSARPRLRSVWARYGAATALWLGALACESAFPGFFRPAIFLFFYPSAYLAAVLGGTGPAFLVIALSAASAFTIFHAVGIQAVQPTAEAFLRLASFAGFSGFGCWLIGRGRLAEQALRESEASLRIFRALADNSSDFIGIADPEGVPLYLNPAGRSLVGLPADMPLGSTTIPEYYAPEARGFAIGVILKSMLERGHWKGETLFRNFQTDEKIPVWDEHFMIRDERGGVLGMGTVTRDLSERRRAVEALRRSEEELRRAQSVGRVGSWRLDVTRNELVWSEETYRIFGLPLGSPLTYDEFLEIVHPDDRARVDGAWSAALRGKPYHVEHRIVVHGEVRWVDERAELELDGRGRALRGVGSVQDVTERRRAEEEVRALRERERFLLALEAAGTAVLVVGKDDVVAFANAEAERLLGWTRSELQGRTVDSMLPSRYRADHAAMLERMFKQEHGRLPMGVGRELSILRKDGAEIPIEVGLTRVTGDGGQDVLVASIVDITQRKAAEGALRESEQRLRLLVEGTRDYAIYMQDAEGRVTLWNEGGRRIFGYAAEEILGTSYKRLLATEPEASAQSLENQRLALERGSLAGEEWRVRKDGERFLARVVITPIYGSDGRHLGFGKVVQDLTEQKRAETQLRETAERLRRTVLELESFAYTISHDLRSPLRAIEGYAHFLSRRLAGSPDAEVRRMLERTGRAAGRLDVLIRDLLSYNAIARQAVELAPVDLDEVLAHVAGHYPEIAAARLVVRAPLGRALGQPSLLIQVFSNLLVNAVKFVPPDRRPRIEVWCERAGGWATIVVQDNGIGIPREAWERVFKPFERLHPDAGYEGTGIGLAIVKRAVEKMGGRVTLESEPGRGSRFRVELKDA